MKRLFLLCAVLMLVGTACASPTPVGNSPTPASTPVETISPTASLTGTPQPPTSTPTLLPVMGTLTIKVNVRSGPGTSYDALGLLDAGQQVQIVSQDSQGKWYQILYPSAPQGLGWVTAQYVQVGAGAEIPLEASSTPAGPTGRIVQRLNVRSGPGTAFDSLGLLEPDTIVSLTGKNATASWFQIVYPAGPDGRGWVTAQYVRTEAADGLPVLDDYGTPVAVESAETPFAPDVTPTPTIGPAPDDGDSRSAPAVQVNFSANGTRRFTYSSQVSAPQGDAEDWVGFMPYAASGARAQMLFSLACNGNANLDIEIWQAGAPLSGWGSLACGDVEVPITLTAGQPYQVRLSPASRQGLRLVNYVLTVENLP